MISQEYKEVLLKLRERRKWGTCGWKRADDVTAFANEVGAKSVLDYGAGEQSLGGAIDLEYHAYDPAVPGIDKRPIPECDIVVALDVMEHVEPMYTQAVLEDIWEHARLGVYLYIPVTKAHTILPDGRNAHINIKTPVEWLWLISAYPTRKIVAEYDDHAIKVFSYHGPA